MSAGNYAPQWPMMPRTDAAGSDRLSGARWLLTAIAARTYDESAGSVAGLLTLGVDWLKRHQLAALAWLALRRAYLLPSDVSLDLRQAYYLAVGDTELHRQELRLVLTALNRANLTAVAFKGAALAYTVYSDPACRLMGDLDLWLGSAEMAQAQAALEAVGYRFVAKVDRPLALMEMHSGEIRLHGSGGAADLVELHFGVFAGEWLRRVACVDEAAIRARCQPIELAACPAWTLALEDHLVQVAIHNAINHQLSLSAVRSLVDIALLARHAPLDWPVIVQRAREWRVATATWLILSLAVELCGLTEAAEAARQLAPSRLRQKLIGLFANARALVDLRDLSKSRWRYVYLLLMVDRQRDAVKLVYRALWPEDEWLQARYGRAGVGTRLRHLLDAARGKI